MCSEHTNRGQYFGKEFISRFSVHLLGELINNVPLKRPSLHVTITIIIICDNDKVLFIPESSERLKKVSRFCKATYKQLYVKQHLCGKIQVSIHSLSLLPLQLSHNIKEFIWVAQNKPPRYTLYMFYFIFVTVS